MKVITGGYYITTPAARPDYMDKKLMPDTILSVSECICVSHPKINVLWGSSKEEKHKYAQLLNITEHIYEDMEKWIDDKLEAGLFMFPHMFITRELAKEFIYKFTHHFSDAKIIGIGLSEEYVEGFIEYEGTRNKPEENQSGIEKLLLSSRPMDEESSRMIGYEVLGFESGKFHSYLCNGLEKDFEEHFNFILNENGLIPSLAEADRYCEYCNDDDLGTESVLWLPWKIFEYTK